VDVVHHELRGVVPVLRRHRTQDSEATLQQSRSAFDVPWGPLRLAQRPVPAPLQFAPSFAVLENSL
jgi:hypothetical protein